MMKRDPISHMTIAVWNVISEPAYCMFIEIDDVYDGSENILATSNCLMAGYLYPSTSILG